MKKATSLALFAGFLFLYTLTLRPGVLPADSGEFQLAASQFKIAHPPGFPLYILVGWLFVQLPGTAASNLNFLSALISSFTLGMLPLIIGELPALREKRSGLFASVGGVTAAVILGTSTTFWSQATTTNIRSLTTLFAALGFYFLLKWVRLAGGGRHAIRGGLALQDGSMSESGQGHNALIEYRPLVTAVLITSLGVTHHLSLAFIALVMVMVVLATRWQVLRSLKLVGWLVLAVLSGLLPWLLLPILEPSLRNWGDFLIYVTGLGFGNDFFFVESAADLIVRLRVMWNVLTFQFHWSILVLVLLALIWISWLRWRVGLLLGGSFLLLTLIAATYRAPQTVEYMLPAYLPLVIGFGWLVTWVTQSTCVGGDGGGTILASKRGLASRPRRPLQWVVLILVLFAGWQTIQRWPQTWDSYRWLANQHDTADYAFAILDNAPEGSTIFSSWHWFTPLSYLQQVEGHRPDLNIVFVDPTFNNDWAGAIQQELTAGRPVVATNFDPDTYHVLPPHLPMGEAFLWPVNSQAAETLAGQLTPTDVVFGDTVLVHGVDQPTQIAMSEITEVTVSWELASELDGAGVKLFIHLVGSNGQIYAQEDLAVAPQIDGLSLTRFELTPRPGIPLGEAQFLLGAYLADGTQLPDPSGEPRTVIGRVEVTGTRWRPVTRHPENEIDPATGWRLIGTDTGSDFGWGDGQSRLYRHWELENGLYWTSVEVAPVGEALNDYVPLGNGITWLGFDGSEMVEPNGSIEVTHHFQADRPILRDIGIAVRQVGYEADNFTWVWLNPDRDNDIPATGAIPSLKWIAGSQVNHPRTLTIPENATTGQTTEGFLRLYDVFTRRPVPILDDRVTADGRPWVRYSVGSGVVRSKK